MSEKCHLLVCDALQAPLLALIGFGGHLLFLLVAGALSFRSCPEDAKALQEVIRTHWACLSHNPLLGAYISCRCPHPGALTSKGLHMQDICRAREDLKARGFHFSTG